MITRSMLFSGIPKRIPFEWTSAEAINHSKEAVLVAQYMADFFVDQGEACCVKYSKCSLEFEPMNSSTKMGGGIIGSSEKKKT